MGFSRTSRPGIRTAVMLAALALAVGMLTVWAVPARADSPLTLQQSFNNVGITTASDATTGNFDGVGDSFSAEGLAADALSPGGSPL